MKEVPAYIQSLLIKKVLDALTEEEAVNLSTWMEKDIHNATFSGRYDDVKRISEDLRKLSSFNVDSALLISLKRIKQLRKKYVMISAYLAAAVVLIVFGIALYYNSGFVSPNRVVKVPNDTIIPGSNKATLTLEDGSIINLRDVSQGIVVTADDISYMDGQESINTLEPEKLVASKVVELGTPKGGTYQVRLSDGTIVWLNAESKLRYPLQFSGEERVVSLEGEAYFEVAKSSKPFRVKMQEQEVEVLGTHFNINGYKDAESVQTTLLEGSVKVLFGSKYKIMSPGQQCLVKDDLAKIVTINAEYAIAWKEGFFMFDHENLLTVMNKISRWYNVEVIYQDDSLKEQKFFGTISKYDKIQEVLDNLEGTGLIKTRISGRCIIISRK